MKKNISNSAEALKKLVEESFFEIAEIESYGEKLLDLDLDQLLRLRSWSMFMQDHFKRIEIEILELSRGK